MAEPSRAFKSHTRWYPPFHFVALPILFVNFLYQGYHAVSGAVVLHGLGRDRGGAGCWCWPWRAANGDLGAGSRHPRRERLRLHRLLSADLQPKHRRADAAASWSRSALRATTKSEDWCATSWPASTDAEGHQGRGEELAVGLPAGVATRR